MCHHHIAYNSCKNRHCPKCQGPAASDWMAARAEDLQPVEYFHIVFTAWLAPFRKSEWVVYDKPPFGGPAAVLSYLSRYTHRVAISNTRPVSAGADTVAFRWKDYRIETCDRQKVMRLTTDEFIRRFLIRVLPDGFHHVRHNGLLASSARKTNIAKLRTLLGAVPPQADPQTEVAVTPLSLREPCPRCGGPLRIVEIFRHGQKPRSRAPPQEQAA